jgi:hypothetical protein
MYQSSTRKNFLDILLDPTAIAILGSLALHAILYAGLPLFAQLEPAGKKSGPTTVKVVELTPNEIQRIPQAPPVPTPQVLPPTRPVAPSSPTTAPPSTFSTAPQTIPFSPLRPTDGTIFKSPTAGKPKVVPKKKPINSIFDPNAIFQTPVKTPKPKSQKDTTLKPSPSVAPKPINKKSKKLVTPLPNTETDDDGGDRPPTKIPPTNNSNRRAQQPSGSTTPAKVTPTTPANSPPTQSASDETSGNGFYGKYIKDATQRVRQYITKYPDIKLYPPKSLSQPYPPGIACSKVKQPSFIVLMVAFDKVPPGQNTNILGDNTSPLLGDERPYFKGDSSILANKKLLEIATTAGFADATEADKNRPQADRGKPVLYQYRVQFDPASCKNN